MLPEKNARLCPVYNWSTTWTLEPDGLDLNLVSPTYYLHDFASVSSSARWNSEQDHAPKVVLRVKEVHIKNSVWNIESNKCLLYCVLLICCEFRSCLFKSHLTKREDIFGVFMLLKALFTSWFVSSPAYHGIQ